MSMQNITREKIENDYKEAIRNKYASQKNTDKYSYYLDNPSQALLRDLCRETLKSNPRTDDLNVYRIFFRFDFNPNEENTSIQYTDKFRKIGELYREGRTSTRVSTLDLAAVLVDFQPRPFKKFKEKGYIEIDKLEGPGQLVKNSFLPEIFFEERNNKNHDENVVETNEVNFDKDENAIEEESLEEEEEDDLFESEILSESEISNGEENLKFEENSKVIQNSIEVLKSQGFLGEVKKSSFFDRLLKRSKPTMIATTIIFCLVGTVIYFAFFKKNCIQWSDDHYEVVDCTLGIEGNVNDILPLEKNESLLDFRRLEVCDTTTCFKNSDEAIVWYSKKDNKVDFFNRIGNGRNPENKGSLKPVTKHIIDRYKKEKCN